MDAILELIYRCSTVALWLELEDLCKRDMFVEAEGLSLRKKVAEFVYPSPTATMR